MQVLLLLLSFLLVGVESKATSNELSLSRYSENYNTRYIYCGKFSDASSDTVYYVDCSLPKSFVVEMGTLKDGEKTLFLYDDDKELILSNKQGCLSVDGRRIGKLKDVHHKISLYFVKGKIVVYLDDQKKKKWRFQIDKNKRIGVRLSKDKGYTCQYFNCYEPVTFKVADYGDVLEEGEAKTRKNVRIAPHNVGENYNLTFPTDVVRNSKRSIRFEYRYEDTKKEGINRMRRARSEISGVFSRSPKNKWIIEYDLYIPDETEDDSISEIITQIHEGSKTPTTPSFCLYMTKGNLGCSIKGDSLEVALWKGKRTPGHMNSQTLQHLQKNKWYHVKVYLKEGWEKADQPLTKVWIDNKLLFESEMPNCYRYDPTRDGYYNYLKFGIYKSGWLKAKNVSPKLQTRAYVFDNYVVKY